MAKRLRACIAPPPRRSSSSFDDDASADADPERVIEGLPDFAAAGSATLPLLLAAGADLEREQEAVNTWKLSEDYMKKQSGGGGLLGLMGTS